MKSTQRKSLIVIITVAMAATGCGQTPPLEDASAAAMPNVFDPMVQPKDTLPREPFLDPISFFSDQAYVVRTHAESAAPVDTDAGFVGGDDRMVSYIKEKVLAFVAPGIGWLKPPALNFTVDAHGRTEDVKLIKSSGNVELDHLLIQLFVDMPVWEPATDANGERVKQAFEFTVGSGGC
jgi:TonB family protein